MVRWTTLLMLSVAGALMRRTAPTQIHLEGDSV
ncbi:hypothetical protein LMG27952_00599 [Paraburkholderia hiiakae]|uniref:Uncharacterized protein n=1 Tax=Paraburkholderia hiiakae TaxID=1081782 RepID=A0ABM8NAZ0_9BURK|nr:hypothetical protein LMG27952_00599 [Paraburkholderia hiiakae]